MKIEFECTEEDMIEFNLFHISRSPSIKRQILLMQITLTILVIIAILYVRFLSSNHLSFLDYLISLSLGIVIYFRSPHIYRKSTVQNIKRLLKEGNNKSVLGHNSLSLSSEGIFGKSSVGESKLNWSSVDKVLQNDKYIFIYIGAINALVVPKKAFPSSLRRKEFLDYLNSHIVYKGS